VLIYRIWIDDLNKKINNSSYKIKNVTAPSHIGKR